MFSGRRLQHIQFASGTALVLPAATRIGRPERRSPGDTRLYTPDARWYEGTYEGQMKIGVVGCGMISSHHLYAATRYAGNQVVGVVDRDLTRARAQAKRFSVPAAFDKLADLLALGPDVVHVLTPPMQHLEVVIAALEGGAHVYVEKPMALTVAECDAMGAAAAAAGRQLCVGHNWLYSPAMLEAQTLIASGRFGEILQVATSFNYDIRRNPNFGRYHWSKDLPGGLAEDLAVHQLGAVVRLLGAPLKAYAVGRPAPQIPGGKSADLRAVIEGERGIGSIAVSLRALPDMGLLDIWCERGMIRANISSMTLSVVRDLPVKRSIARGLSNFDVAAQLVGSTIGTTLKLIRRKVDGSYGIVPLVHAFYRALETSQPAPVSALEGKQAVQALRSLWPYAEPVAPAVGIAVSHPVTSAPTVRAAAGPRVLVTGATGFVGSHLTRALLRRGYAVRILVRNAERAQALESEGAQVVVGDVGEPDTLKGVAEGAEIAFHLASAVSGSSAAFDRTDVYGTQSVLAEAERAGVRRLVFVGTLAGYPLAQQKDGTVIDERCPFDATGLLGHYARAKGEAESVVLAAHRRGALEAVIVRLGLVCGIGANALPPHVCQKAPRGWVILFGDGNVPLPLTYIDNSVEALVLAATAAGAAGESFNIVDDDVLTQREYLALLHSATRGRPRVLRLPAGAYHALGLAAELAAAARKKEPSTNRYRVRTRLARVRWDCSKAKRVLQWHPRTPLRDGLAATFQYYASKGLEG
jgi:2-alkyl-3-oxoalkanoate reductase